MGDRPDARPLLTQDNTQKNADTQTCLEWDLNPRSQFSSGRIQYVTQTARPLGPAFTDDMDVNYLPNSVLETWRHYQ